MKKFYVVLTVLLTSCAGANVDKQTTGTVEMPIATCHASYYSFFKDMSDINMRACDAEGGANSASEKLSGAVTNALIRGLQLP